MEFIRNYFGYRDKNSTFLTEVFGGLITFVAMIYILPTNAKILGDIQGASYAGVFTITALLSGFCCILMGAIANYPIALSAGMGLNAFISYTVGGTMGFNFQECMILLTCSGIIFFIISITPFRTYLINKIPESLKSIISAGFGGFLCFVGLNGSGIVDLSGEVPALGDLTQPYVLIPFLGVFIIVILMFAKNKWLSKLAIPIGVISCAIIAISVNYGVFGGDGEKLPKLYGKFGVSGLGDVVFFGALNQTASKDFGTLLAKVFSNPSSYIAIFSLVFVNLFDTTATLLAIANDCDLLDENGELKNAKRVIMVDASGALICAPLGTSTLTSFAESNIGISFGARTGIMAITTGLLFILSAFIYPVFSVIDSWSVTAPALICVGGLIFANNLKTLDWKDFRIGIVCFFMVIFMLLTYSLTNGLGVGIILFVAINLISGRKDENNFALYLIASLFALSFILTAVMTLLNR